MAELQELYDEEFQKRRAQYSYDSAQVIVKLMANYYKPKSVLDLGCGSGTFLKAWSEIGVEDIMGVDISDLSEDILYVPKKNIVVSNLETYRNNSDKKYDLVESLEVAEHLNQSVAADFVKNLTSYSDVVLFSAALPEQDGTGHINCQLPKYGIKLFKKEGYVCFDCLRKELIDYDDVVNCCYIQNILVFVKENMQHIFTEKGFKPTENPFVFYHVKYVNAIIANYKADIKQISHLSQYVLPGISSDTKIIKRIKLFNVLPIYSIISEKRKSKHYLFGFLPLFKTSEKVKI